jgi:hypothetical protein
MYAEQADISFAMLAESVFYACDRTLHIKRFYLNAEQICVRTRFNEPHEMRPFYFVVMAAGDNKF